MDLNRRGSEFPGGKGEVFFDALLDGIGEIVEEVDAGVVLELSDADGVFAHVGRSAGLAVVLVFEPEGDAAVHAIFHLEERHKVVCRHGYAPIGHIFEHADITIGGAALHNVERIGEGTVATEVLHQSLERSPIFLVEVTDLRTHVAHVEGLVVGFSREEPVGRGHEVPVVVAVEREVGGERLSTGQQRVGGVLRFLGVGFAPHLFGPRFGIEAKGYPTGVEERDVVVDGIVEDGISAGVGGRHAMDEEAFGGGTGELGHLDACCGTAIGRAHFARCGLWSRIGRGNGLGRLVRPGGAPMDVGLVVSVAGDEGQSETAEGEEKSVHGRVVERKHTARTGCASGVREVGMRPADAAEAGRWHG